LALYCYNISDAKTALIASMPINALEQAFFGLNFAMPMVFTSHE